MSHFTSNGKPPVEYIDKICPNCEKSFTVRNTRSNKNQITCSTGCYNSFFRSGKDSPNYIHGASTYRNKAIKYYGHKCVRCGFEEVVEVHHKDRDRTNNNLSNLEVLCPNCHVIAHS